MSNSFSLSDIEADNDRVSNDHEDDDDPVQNISKLILDNNNESCTAMYVSSNNKDQHVPLPRKRKAWFFFSYSSFLISYLVFVLVIAYTYPLKPVCNIESLYLPVFDDELSNITEQQINSLSLELNFINRNPVISFLYEGFLNITIYYLPDTSGTRIYLANTTALGFHQHNRKPKKVSVEKMPAPGVPRLLQLLKQNETYSTAFLVELVFTVRYKCGGSCKHKKPLLMTISIPYAYYS